MISGTEILLRRWSVSDVDGIVSAVNETLEELRPWMPWAQEPVTREGVSMVVDEAIASWRARREFQYVILPRRADPPPIIGCCGLHDRIGPGALEIGYWVRSSHMGRGIATEAAGLLTRTALSLEDLESVQIRCDESNTRSAAVPRRLGYRLDRIEPRPPETLDQTDRQMVWSIGRESLEE